MLPRPMLWELERRCQKPDHRRVGNWMARRLIRPAALRVTYVVAPWGVSANVTTLAAWASGVAAACLFGWGSPIGWLLAVAMLQLWYLLDHVDGQLARFHGTASLDGTQLDYLMHHTIHLLVPLGIGYGLFVATDEPVWLVAGAAWGVALLLGTLHHDARYKAFVKRLKRLQGRLTVEGGGGSRPEPQPPLPRNPVRLAAYLARKACEMHVLMNVFILAAIGAWWAGDTRLVCARILVLLLTPTAVAVTGWTLFRSQREQQAEREFAAWYRVPPDHELCFLEGWWHVCRSDSGQETFTAPANSRT